MIKINTILMSLGIVLALILSAVNSTSLTTTTTPPVSDPLVVDPWPQLEVVKQVMNPTTHHWTTDPINANVGDTVRFNITVKYFDLDPNDACRLMTKIHIVDHLENNFKYNDALSMHISWPSPLDPTAFMTFDSGKKHITWDFGTTVVLSETSGYLPSIFYLEFNATVNASGSLNNYVEVNAMETCCGVGAYGNASVLVNVCTGNCDITVANCVAEDGGDSWNPNGIEINCVNGVPAIDWVTFRICVTNTGSITIPVTVKDILPNGLIYDGSATVNGNPHEPDFKDGQNLYWYFDGLSHSGNPLAPGQSVCIKFRAKMGQCGILYLNKVNVTGGDCTDEDTASVKWLCCTPQGNADITVKKRSQSRLYWSVEW